MLTIPYYCVSSHKSLQVSSLSTWKNSQVSWEGGRRLTFFYEKFLSIKN